MCVCVCGMGRDGGRKGDVVVQDTSKSLSVSLPTDILPMDCILSEL